jgi:3-oxoacyl-[acyl-carrier protein] reductase
MLLNLTGNTALICGSSQGLGKAVAVQFAEMGADCILLARNEKLLKSVVSELPKKGSQNHTYIQADFSEPENVAEKVKQMIDNGTAINILINNSGGPAPGPINEASTEQLNLAFNQHVIMSQLLSQAVIPGMKTEGWGRIINIISIGAKQPIKNLGVSNTIRGAMMSWSKTLARELAPFGITVNNLLPGHTSTARLDSLIHNRSKQEGRTEEEISSEMISDIPIGRFVKPEELGFAAGFLASPEAGAITGVSLPVDGGWLECF